MHAQGAVLQISSDRNDRMGGHNQNPKKPLGLQTKPPKNPWTKIQPPKPFYLSHIVTATQKYICLVTQENPEIENFTPKILL